MAFLIREVFQRYKCPTRINYCGEKHGKGLIDGIFAHAQGWIENFLSRGSNQLISSLDDLVSVCKEGASHDTRRDPAGVEWVVEKLSRDRKPAFSWTLSEPQFKLKRTYCLEVVRTPARTSVGLKFEIVFFRSYSKCCSTCA